MPAELSGSIITQEAGDGCAGARQNADQVADDPGSHNRRPKDAPFVAGETHLISKLRCLSTCFDLFLRKDEYLAHREEPDQGAGCVDAFGKVAARHETLDTGDWVQTDGGNQQAKST